MACICIGPISSGKTLLLKRLQGIAIDISSSTVETVGTNIVQVPKIPSMQNTENGTNSSSSNAQGKEGKDFVSVREIGGAMSPLWPSYYNPYKPVVYVIDSSNLFQVSIATVHLMEILTHEKLVRCRILVLLAKKDLTDAKKLNLLKFMMRLDTIVNQVGKRMTLLEVSSMTGDGIDEVRSWLVENSAFCSRLYQIENGIPLSTNE